MIRSFLLGTLLLLPVLALRAPADSVPNTVPRGWDAAAWDTNNIAVEFDAESGNPTNIVLHSAWRGIRAGSVSTDGARTAFAPASPLLPGEPVEGVLVGEPGESFSWRFQTAAAGGGAAFVTNLVTTAIGTNAGARFRNIALADLNGDSKLDIVAPAYGSNAVVIALNGSSLSLLPTQVQGIQDVAVADFNADGRPDLLFGCSTATFALATGNVGGGLSFGGIQAVPGVTGPLRQVAVGDLNRDGKPDAVTIAETSGHVIPLLNNGSGSLAPGSAIPGSPFLYGLDVGDLDRDGMPDVVTVGSAGSVSILKGNGDGTFGAPDRTVVSGENLYACRIADFNQDGYADIAAVGGGGTVIVGTGSASNFTFAVIDHGLSLMTLYGLAVADCDANGLPDIVACGGNGVAVLLAGSGGFRSTQPPIIVPNALLRDVEIGDLNDDGCLDLVVCDWANPGKAIVFWNAPAPVPLIRGKGLDIQTGESADINKGTDFGYVPLFSTVTNSFQLINRGKGLLTITGSSLSGVSTSLMHVINMPEMVMPGATSIFSIVYSPSTTGTAAAVLSISNNSLSTVTNAASPYIINLAGGAIRARPVISFGETNQTYDGTAREVVVTTIPVTPVAVLYDGLITPPVTAGVYTVTVDMDNDLYYGSATGLLTVAKRPLTASCASASRAYGEANPIVSVTLTNFIGGEGLTNLTALPVAVCSATSNSPVGTYPIIASGGSAANYSFVSSNGILTVTQTLLVVKADNTTRNIGEANPLFTVTIGGWKNGEGTNVFTAQPVATTPAIPSSPSGTYPINVAGGAALNYSFSYTPGTLTVYGVTAEVTITNIDFEYDGNPKAAMVSTMPTGLPVVVTYNGSATAPVTAGVYTVFATITGSDYSGSTNATLIIRKAAQAIAGFLPTNGVYSADRPLTLTASGSPSGIPVSFEVRSGPAIMVSSNEFAFIGMGPVSVAAWQPEGDNWSASPALTNTFSAWETNRVHFAALAGQTPRWPYTSWDTAASNIQTAVDQADAGETVLVGPGLYETGGRAASGASLDNRLVLEKAVTVHAVAGPASTFIVGRPGSGSEAPLGADAVRCAFVTDGALLSGFTLTNGFTAGALGAVSDQVGGGAALTPGGLLSNCVVSGCGAVSGGGLRGGSATRSRLTGNQARFEGGGATECTLSACLLWNNAAPYGGGAFRCDLSASTLADNAALFGGGTYEGTLVNGIVWYNTGGDCFGTLASHVNAGSGLSPESEGCLGLEPLFVNRAQGNYRLAYGSPCINAGTNGASPIGALDLDGAHRPIHAAVDMGAYEFYGTPGVPVLSSLSDIRAHQAAAAWQPSTGGVRVIRFRIAVSNQTAAAPDMMTLVDAPALSGIVTGLAPKTVYNCRVREENDYDVGGWSGWQSFTTLTEAAIITTTAQTFTVSYAAGYSQTQTVAVANPGATPCLWSGAVAYDGAASGWLSVSPAGGTIGAFDSTGLQFVANAAGLNAGTYSARHTLSSPNATNSPIVQVVTLTVVRATDAITFGATNQVYDGSARPVSAMALSGESVAVTYNGAAAPPVNAGVYAVTGVVDTANWTGVQSTWLTVSRAPQAITTFLPASGDVPSTNNLTLGASGGGSGNTVMFAIVSGPSELLPDNRVRFSDYGAVLVAAAQAGDANWLPAPAITNSYRVVPVSGLTHCVAQAGQTPQWPYASWNEAASNIQVAVDSARDGDAVAVSNGVYQAGGRTAPGGTIMNRICITRAIELYSVRGPADTIVAGATPVLPSGLDAVRGLYAGTNAVIRGFTFTGGHTASSADLAQDRSGGGVYLTGGAEMRLCIVTGNSAAVYGGGVFVQQNGRVNNCLLTENTSAQGGGLCLYAGGEAVHCTIASNTALTAAGGVYIPNGGVLANSIVWGNRAPGAARKDLLPLVGSVTFTCAGDGVTDGVAGCRVADPLFNPGGFIPVHASPCVNAGNDGHVISEFDLRGDPRVVETVDMGAYENIVKAATPKSLSISELMNTSVKLHWQPGDAMPVTAYTIGLETLAGEAVFSTQTPGTTTATVVAGLSEGIEYRWRVQAMNSEGVSEWTFWQTFITPGIILTVTPASCNVGGGVEILVEGRRLGQGSDIDNVSLCGVPAVILDQGTNWVRVMAPTAPFPGTGAVSVSSPIGGEIVGSNAFTFLSADAPVMLPPANLTVTSLAARWEGVLDAGHYQLQVSDSSNFTSFLPGFEGTNVSAAVTRLDVPVLVPGYNYMRVRAWFAQGYGPFSDTMLVKRRLDALTITGTNAVYDGTAKPVLASVMPASLASSVAVLYNGSATPPATVGVYNVSAEVSTELYYGVQTGSLSITKRVLTATAENGSRAYGEPNPGLFVSVTNFASGEGADNLITLPGAVCDATSNSPVGPYGIFVSGGAADNYSFTYSNGTLTVTQTVLTVTADNKTWFCDATNPPLTLVIEGWKNGDGTNALMAQPVASTPATDLSPPGTYPITVAGASAVNYAFHYVSGVLTLNPSPATVLISGTNQVYNGNPKVVTVTTIPAELAVAVTYNLNAAPPVTAGVYAVHAEVTASNYYGSTNATMTIGKADQAVTSFLPASGDHPADQLLTLSAVGSASGIPVSFVLLSGPAEQVSSNQIRFLGYGPVVVSARQAGDANWNASPALTNTYAAVDTNTVYYVAMAGQTPRWPYVTWETAASNIQTAVDQADAGETVLVGAGRYDIGGRPAAGASLLNRLVLDKAVTVDAVAGSAATVLVGQPGSGSESPLGADAVRCVFMADGAVLSGFTLTNGFTAGELGAISDQQGGGAYLSSGSLLSNCVVSGCGAVFGGGLRGGRALQCSLSGNQARQEGGGAWEATLATCLVWNNAAPYGGGAFRCDLTACTLADNAALYGGGSYEGTLVNGIAWYNTGWDCFGTVAAHVNAGSGIEAGVKGCLAEPPVFVNRAQGNYRLAYGSPCINAGTNAASPAGSLDLDGGLRPIHAAVDMGAYEFFGTPSVPILISLSDIHAHQVSLAWPPSTDDVRVIRFRIAVTNLAALVSESDVLVVEPDLSGLVTGLAPNTPYACRVRAENDYDNSGWSEWQSFITLTEAAIASETALTFNATFASGQTSTQEVVMANPGATPCVWNGTVDYDGGSSGWLTVSPADGTVEAFGSTGILFVANAAGLNAGTYTARNTLSSPNATNSPIVQVVTLTVVRATDAITFGATNQVYDGTARTVIASAFSGESVAVTYNGSATPPVNAGVYAVTGVVDALNWTGVHSTWLTVSKAPQGITAFLPASGDVPSTNILTLSAADGGSGNPVLFAIVSGPAVMLPGNRVRFSDYGDVLVAASQAGDSNWLPAPTITNSYKVVPILGLTHFVAMAGQTPQWPYASWNEAASNIQVAVDVACDGDAVAVSNGLYQAGGRVAPGGTIMNRICITRAIELYSVNGPADTIVAGAAPVLPSGLDAVRGLYAGTNALVRGFTVTGGYSALTADLAQDRSGGGVYLTGGAELQHCIVTANQSAEYGGGVFVQQDGLVNNCLIAGNRSGQGGGLCLYSGGDAVQCTISSNIATMAGGGAYLPNGGTIGNSIVWGNEAPLPEAQDLVSLGGSIAFTCAGDGVADGVAGCRVADPLFVAGFKPGAGSPCVDAGDDARVLTELDLKNDLRVVATVDMGAYEYLAMPAAPKDLAVSGLTGVSAVMMWQPGDIMPVFGYDLELENASGLVLAESVSGTITSLVAAGLSEGTGYRWRVRGANSQGAGEWTAWQSFFTQGVVLSVTPASCNVGGGVEVLIEGIGLGHESDIGAVSLCGVSAVILDQGTNWVLVRAPEAVTAGSGDVCVSSPTGGDLVLSNAFTFLSAPAPVLLPPTDLTDSSLMARWESLAGADGYQLQVSTAADFSAFLPGFDGTNVSAAITQLEVYGLVPGTHYLRLRAWFAQGYGPFSAVYAVPSGTGIPWVRNPIGDKLATAGDTLEIDLGTVFAGSGLTFSVSGGLADSMQPAVTGAVLTVRCGPLPGTASILVTATHTDSGYSVSAEFWVEVMPAALGSINVNCGGRKTGVWMRDNGYTGGTAFGTKAPIGKVKYFPLAVYQSCRVGPRLTYSFPGLPNGTYNVRLAFAELIQDLPGTRVFKIKIEGVTVLPHLDVLSVVSNKFTAYRPLFKVMVKDGNGLQIQGIGLNGSDAFFNGIQITPVPPAGMGVIPAGMTLGIDPDAGPYALTNKALLYVDVTEITKQAWDEVRNWGLANGYPDLPEGEAKGTNHPVQMVSWHDCVKWCNARSQKEGLPPAYYTTAAMDSVYTSGIIDLAEDCVADWAGYRLPTEAEWEFAARCGSSNQRFPWGDTIGHAEANYYSDSAFAYDTSETPGFHPACDDGVVPFTCAVGSFGAHGYGAGLYDMAGNVAEWCWDPASTTNRVMRGGAWSTDASGCRIAQRLQGDPAVPLNCTGFRTVRPRP